MTSATGKKGSEARDRRRPGDGAAGAARRRAFTLLELALAMSLLVLLAGVAVLGFSGGGGGRDLEEGASRLEAGLRMARAEAARRGGRFCLVLRSEAGDFQVLWEPEPLAAPGQFVPYAARTWPEDLPAGLVELVRLELTGEGAYLAIGVDGAPLVRSGIGEDADFLIFLPDGTSDSAIIELAAVRDPQLRRAVIELEGLTGQVRTRILTLAELDAYYEARLATTW